MAASRREPAASTVDVVRSALATSRPRSLPAGPMKRAAVLVPLVPSTAGAGLDVLFTRRSDHLGSHAGQVSFPGGGRDAADSSAEATALREAHEEVGLAPTSVEVLGRLDDMITITGFHVRPIVGHVRGPFEPKPDPREVDEVFRIGLDALLDMTPERRPPLPGRIGRSFLVYPTHPYVVWGATAKMLTDLLDRLRGGRGAASR